MNELPTFEELLEMQKTGDAKIIGTEFDGSVQHWSIFEVGMEDVTVLCDNSVILKSEWDKEEKDE